jgi:hypothetical protein
VTNAGESANEIDAAHTESAEEFVVGRHVDVETVFVGRGTQRRSATFFEFIAIQRICCYSHQTAQPK